METNLTCPWQGFETPALTFCEEALCAWVKTPANAWSSLAFCLVGLWIIKREYKNPDQFLIGFGPMSILVGLLSWFYHASLTRIGEIGDLSSMFLIGNWLAITNIERSGWLNQKQGRIYYWLANAVSIGLLFWLKDLGAPLFFVQCMVALVLELRLRKLGKGPPSYKYMWYGFFFWITAQTIWFLDLHRIVCSPENHFWQGHAIWHVLMAGLTWCIYLHSAYTRKTSV